MCLTFEMEGLANGEFVCLIFVDGELMVSLTKENFEEIKKLMEW